MADRTERERDPAAQPHDEVAAEDDRGADMGAGYDETLDEEAEQPRRGPGVEDAFRGGS